MKILLVEDNAGFADDLRSSLSAIAGVMVEVAGSRDSAFQKMEAEFYDTFILDLSIPTQDRGLDVEKEHGQSVFYRARGIALGTPIWILTGSEPDQFTSELLEYGENLDIWGSGESFPNIRWFPKERADKLVESIRVTASEVARTEAIGIDTHGKNIDLSIQQRRALQIFTRRSGGTSCLAEVIGGGLSGAKVFRITVRDERGSVRAVFIAKLGLTEKIAQESAAYQQVQLLAMNAFTPLVCKLDRGLKDHSAVFYAIAEGYGRTLFDLISKNPDVAPKVIGNLHDALGRWIDAKFLVKVPIREIRRRVLSDEKLAELRKTTDLPFVDEIERVEVAVYQSCVHGDLHGGNILVSNQDIPVIIDFGDVGNGFACMDPTTLEMSLFFHPDSRRLGIYEKLEPLISHWPDIDRYLENNALAEAIKACRDWAHQVSGSDHAVLAAGYAFALRQLKYEHVDKKITLKLLGHIAEKIRRPG